MFIPLSQTKEPEVTSRKNLIFWTGPKHSGKTTRAVELVQAARREGFSVAGFLAPSLYRNGKLIGFDVLELQNNTCVPLARREEGLGTKQFTFIEDGIKLGKNALSIIATNNADLIIVDEFGPLELEGKLWRKNVDVLLARSDSIILLLVVRKELVKEVSLLYTDFLRKELVASEPESIDEVINILKCITHNLSVR